MAKKSSRRLIVIFLLFALGGLAVYGFTMRPHKAVEIDPARLARARRGDMARSVVAVGRIEPVAKVEIKSKANGIIKELKVNVGDTVKEGQILAELDKENLIARLREAQAAQLASQASLQAFEAEYQKDKVEADSPEMEFVRRNFQRSERLFKSGLLPQQRLDDNQRELEMVEKKAQVARSQLSIDEARVAQARAAVEQATATVESANEELKNATIRSPIKAVVLSRNVEVGSPVSSILNMGSAATLVMVLGDINRVYVRGKVDEADIGLVHINQPARIKVETFKDRQYEGKVTEISPMGLEKDNVVTFEVKVSINNPGGILRANMTANAEIILNEEKNCLIVPESAITYDDHHQAWVEVPAPAVAAGHEKRQVKTGISNGAETQIISGLTEDEIVLLP